MPNTKYNPLDQPMSKGDSFAMGKRQGVGFNKAERHPMDMLKAESDIFDDIEDLVEEEENEK